MPRTPRPAWVEAEYRRIGEERAAASRQADRVRRWDLVRTCAEVLGWAVAGAVIAAFAFHVHDRETGMIFWYAGSVVTYGGIVWAAAAAYRRGEKRGDW